jgi:transcriptional antiterminator NusG
MSMRWYIVQAYSNFERKVAESIREQAKQRHLDHLFEEIMVPTEKVVEVRRGQKVDAERKFFPGYVLVKMDLTDEAYHLIKNTPKVTGFLGADNKPMPISDAEAARIMHQVQEGIERPKPSISFEVGEQVRVSEGRSPPSTAPSRKWTMGARGSRSRSRSSGALRRSSSNSARLRSFRNFFDCQDRREPA